MPQTYAGLFSQKNVRIRENTWKRWQEFNERNPTASFNAFINDAIDEKLDREQTAA